MVENADIIMQMVGNMGFPIVVALALVVAGYKLFTNTFKELTNQFKELTYVVANNNKLIERMLDRIDMIWKHGDDKNED